MHYNTVQKLEHHTPHGSVYRRVLCTKLYPDIGTVCVHCMFCVVCLIMCPTMVITERCTIRSSAFNVFPGAQVYNGTSINSALCIHNITTVT